MIPIKVIVNPDTNPGVVRQQLRPAMRILRRAGFAVSVRFTRKQGDAYAIAATAAQSGYRSIVAVGGDGTINEVINATIGGDITLGIIPIGTTNVLARELAYPLGVIAAAEVIARRQTRTIDLGIVNGRYFSMMMSCGYDAHAVSIINLKIKRLIRRWAYVWAGLKDFFGYRPTRITVEVNEGAVMETGSFVVISNAHFYGGSYQLTPMAEIDDGKLDILIYQGRSQIGLVHFVFRMIWGQHIKMKNVSCFRTTGATVHSDRKTEVQIDGDYFGDLPVEVGIVPAALTVFVPASDAGRRR
ncbi:diacylglycerol kinase family lipid kinase [bacterium]|nr:diacylglycerol kinase family lipid kinase [bacterium]